MSAAIYDQLRNLLSLHVQIANPTPRQDAAFDLLWKWLWLSATVYGHRECLCDFRIKAALVRYRSARMELLAA